MALKTAALALIALAAGCGRESAPAPPPSANAAATAPAASAHASAPAAPTCAASPRVELDSASFVRDDLPAFAPERLEALRSEAGAAFERAARAACESGGLAPDRLAAVRRLLVQSASGADNVAFYEDAESQPPGTLVFQWTFAEAGLELPEPADVAEGLACWAEPDRPACAEREP